MLARLDKESTIAKVLIVSDTFFIAFFLSRLLVKKGACVYLLSANQSQKEKNKLDELKAQGQFFLADKNKLPDFDYLFQINHGQKNIFNPTHFLKLAAKANAKYLLATQNWEYKEIFNTEKNSNWRLVFYADIYGPSASRDSFIETLFSELGNGRILVEQDGKNIYPLWVEDLTVGLAKAMFSQDSKGREYFLTGNREISLADLAQKVKSHCRQNPEIIYVPKGTHVRRADEKMNEQKNDSWRDLIYKPKKNLDDGVGEIVAELEQQHPEKGEATPKRKIALVYFVLAFLFLLAAPLVISLVLAFFGWKNLVWFKNDLEQGKISQTKILYAQTSFRLSKKIINNIFIFGWPKSQLINKYDNLLSSGEYLSRGACYVSSALQAAEDFQAGKVDFKQIRVDLEAAVQNFSFASIQAGNFPEINSLRQQTIFLAQVTDIVSEAQSKEKKIYLVLLQNNMELRATGGFIGSYGLLTIEDGRMLDFTIDDVYSADGQLKGHVEPPEAIVKYLDQADWYLRDANFSPDFPTSAQQAIWFLDKEIGIKADGVVAINLNLAKDLLSVLGPVFLPDYSEEINAQNIFQRAELHSEVNFFPGSTQKKNFLSNLSSFLIEKIRESGKQNAFVLASMLQKNLLAHDLMLYTTDPNLQAKIDRLGWSGKLVNISYGQNQSFTGEGMADYLMINESNFGVNKANFFINRKINLETAIDPTGEITHKLLIDYQNTSTSSAWPGGEYKNYLRLVTPADSASPSAILLGLGNQDAQALTEIDNYKLGDKQAFGFLAIVPAGTTKRVVVSYKRGKKIPLGGRTAYALYLQKQAGTSREDPIKVTISYPENLKVAKIMPWLGPWVEKNKKIEFADKFSKDLVYVVEFTR